jgi:ribosomal subunit interface protein
MDVGDALRTRIGDELNAGIGKYFDRGGEAEVTLSKDGHGLCCDVTVRLASGQLLQSKGQGGDAHSAFGSALHKIETRVRRYKQRLKNHHPHGQRGAPAEIAPLMVLRSPDEDGEDEAWDSGPNDAAPPASMVIAETEAAVKTLTVSGAVMELDLTGQPVLLFRHAAHGGLSVVFRRNDGHIGWIDPERTRSAGAAKSGAAS